MTVNGLIAALQAMPAEVRERPVFIDKGSAGVDFPIGHIQDRPPWENHSHLADRPARVTLG
jgi:hypothetical protein